MRVMLVQPSYDLFANDSRQAMPPLGLAYIGAMLERDGHDVQIIDSVVEGFDQIVDIDNGKRRVGLSDDQLTARIREFAPAIVGVSCLFSSQAHNAHRVCELVKAINTDTLCVMGGAHSSAIPAEVLDDQNIDAVVIGEGELTMSRLVASVELGQFPPSDVSGLAFREGETVSVNPTTDFVHDLDELPMPARHLLPMAKYFEYGAPHGGNVKRHPVTNVTTSRGCPAKCNFCSIHTVWGRKFRHHSTQRVIDELEMLVNDYGVKEIQFEDDNLTLDRNRIQEICREIIARKIDITWSTPNGVAIYALDEQTLRLMKQSGCHHICVAVESGNERVLKEIVHKPLKLSAVKPIVRIARKLKIRVTAFFVVGFPGETKAEVQDTLDFAVKLGADDPLFFMATPYPGTELFAQCVELGLIKPPVDYLQMRVGRPMLSTSDWTADELVDMVRATNAWIYRRATLKRPHVLAFRVAKKLLTQPRAVIGRAINAAASVRAALVTRLARPSNV